MKRLAVVVVIFSLACIAFIGVQITDIVNADAEFKAYVDTLPQSRSAAPILLAPSTFSAHLTDAEFYARPANKLGIVEPLDEGIVLRGPFTFDPEEIVEPQPLHTPAETLVLPVSRSAPEFQYYAPIIYGGAIKPHRICRDPVTNEIVKCKKNPDSEQLIVEVSEPNLLALLAIGLLGLLFSRYYSWKS